MNDLRQLDQITFSIKRGIHRLGVDAGVRGRKAIVMEKAGGQALTVEILKQLTQTKRGFAPVLAGHRLGRALQRFDQRIHHHLRP